MTTSLRRGRSGSGMSTKGAFIAAGLSMAEVGGLLIPSAVDPGQAEQTTGRGARSFVQQGAPPGAPTHALLPLRAG
ncbi:hypothetical protein [Streptosporangium minutum]|uniref:hypothetical protein n=1 Tax=Streptosporangium minutum TaxID=569862 RepID=UPI0010563565|nr:hypothetical protein [Streptosporangium minutum]